jgi:hypothetical protein
MQAYNEYDGTRCWWYAVAVRPRGDWVGRSKAQKASIKRRHRGVEKDEINKRSSAHERLKGIVRTYENETRRGIYDKRQMDDEREEDENVCRSGAARNQENIHLLNHESPLRC